MSYVLTDLQAYTDEMSFELISKAVLTTNLMNYVTIRSGLRAGNVAINLLDADISVQDRACGFDTNGTMTFSQVVIDIAEKQSKQELCPTDLRDYYLSERLSPSAYAEEVPFPEVVSNLFVEKIRNWNENYLANQLFDTAAAALATAGTCPNQVATTDAVDVNNVVSIVLELFDAIDESVKDRDDLVVLMNPANFALLRRALVAQNYFHYNQGQGTEDELIIPGTNMKAVRVTLNALDTEYASMIAGPARDMVVGTGLEDDMDSLRIFYDQSNDVVKVMAAWRIGVNFVDVCKFSYYTPA